jgi:hypothetical protein
MEDAMAGFVKESYRVALALLAAIVMQDTALCQDAAWRPEQLLTGLQVVTPAPSGDFKAPSDQQIEMLRKDLRSRRKQLIAANMKLTDAEAEKFWPAYNTYTDELVSINHTKYALLKQYTATYDTMTDAEADNSLGKWIDVDESVAQLRRKYIAIFRNLLPAKKTALFFQLDRQIQMLIDLQLVSALPLVEP